VPRVEYEGLRSQRAGEATRIVAARVAAARERQLSRQQRPNAWLDTAGLESHAPLDAGAERLLTDAARRFRLSARACHRVIKVARTIADLAGRETLASADVAEALDCRRLDRAAPGRAA
jgi:magnesium chelatase family protein